MKADQSRLRARGRCRPTLANFRKVGPPAIRRCRAASSISSARAAAEPRQAVHPPRPDRRAGLSDSRWASPRLNSRCRCIGRMRACFSVCHAIESNAPTRWARNASLRQHADVATPLHPHPPHRGRRNLASAPPTAVSLRHAGQISNPVAFGAKCRISNILRRPHWGAANILISQHFGNSSPYRESKSHLGHPLRRTKYSLPACERAKIPNKHGPFTQSSALRGAGRA